MPKATEEAFKEVSSVGFVVTTVRRSKCWKVFFGIGARSDCTVLHSHSLKDAHYSGVRGVELLSVDGVVLCGSLLIHFTTSHTHKAQRAKTPARCVVITLDGFICPEGKCIIAWLIFFELGRNNRKQDYVYFSTPPHGLPALQI